MVYYRYSYLSMILIPRYMRQERFAGMSRQECINAVYDGKGNPYAKLYSKRELHRLLKAFQWMECHNQYFDKNYLGDLGNVVPQDILHRTAGRVLGRDLYFAVQKK